MTTASFTRDVWAEVTNTTRETYVNKMPDLIARKRLILALLKKKGCIKLNHDGGDHLAWPFRYKESTPIQFGDGNPITFTRKAEHKQAAVAWKSYIDTDQLNWQNAEMNKGQAALVKLSSVKLKNLLSSMQNFFTGELFGDGSGAQELDGLEALFATSTTVAGDIVAKPGDTYGTLSTAFDTSASWTTGESTSPNASIATDWPYGSGDAHADYWSPVIANDSSNAWGTSSTTWEDNCLRVLRFLTTVQAHRCAKSDGQPDLFLTTSSRMIDLKNRLEQRFRTTTPSKEAEELGFKGTIQYDGVTVDTDFECPAASGYLLSCKNMELVTPCSKLILSEGPDWYGDRQAWLMLVKFLGNTRFSSPKFQAKTAAVA